MTEKQIIAPSASALERTFRYNRLWLHLLLAGAKVATGQAPREVIWTKNKATLYRYVPSGETRFPVPLLLIYALIDRPFILDLIPGNSLVEYLVKQGFDVYLLDWGIPDDEDHALAFDDYAFDYLAKAVRQVLRTSRAEAVTLFGACILVSSHDKEFCVLQGGHIGMLAGAEARCPRTTSAVGWRTT